MRIGIVGGLDRAGRDLEEVARSSGHALEKHSGVISGGAAAANLKALVARSDLVLVLTEVNSHNAVHIARRAARENHRPLRLMRRLSPRHLAAFLNALPVAGAAAAR